MKLTKQQMCAIDELRKVRKTLGLSRREFALMIGAKNPQVIVRHELLRTPWSENELHLMAFNVEVRYREVLKLLKAAFSRVSKPHHNTTISAKPAPLVSSAAAANVAVAANFIARKS